METNKYRRSISQHRGTRASAAEVRARRKSTRGLPLRNSIHDNHNEQGETRKLHRRTAVRRNRYAIGTRIWHATVALFPLSRRP